MNTKEELIFITDRNIAYTLEILGCRIQKIELENDNTKFGFIEDEDFRKIYLKLKGEN